MNTLSLNRPIHKAELLVILLLMAFGLRLSAEETFTFRDGNKSIEGYLALPKNPTKTLILYFHRASEDRNAVLQWAKELNPAGYAVAGYTSTRTPNFLEQAQNAVAELRKRKDLTNVPLIAMGASMGTPAAASLFGSSPQVRGLVLLVPGEAQFCSEFAKASGRPILMIYAENDEVVDAETSKRLVACLPKVNAQSFQLKDQGHRFPPSLVSARILDWLKGVLAK
jgi:predicted esterase